MGLILASTKKIQQVSLPTKFAYGMGHSLLSVKNMLFHFFFLFFFSNILGVPALLVGVVTVIALFVDAFTDPIMGQISDNYRSTKWGRRHRFMLWSIIPTGVALVTLFLPPASLGSTGLFIWMLVFALLVRIGLTVYGVPYYALSAELSTAYNERTSITAIREFFNNTFSMIMFILAFVVFLPEAPEFEDGMMNKAGYGPLVITLAIIGGLGALVATYGTRHKIPDLRRYTDDARTGWKDSFKQLRLAANIQSFLWLCGGFGLTLMLYGAGSALSLYMGVYLWQLSQEEKLLLSLAPFISLIPAVILAIFMSAKLDKKPTVLFFAIIYMLCSLLPYLAYRFHAMPDLGDPALLTLLAIAQALGFSALTGIIIITSSMLADVADEMELATTKRQEGVLSAAYSFAQKMTFAMGTLIAAVSLVVIQFPKQADPSDVSQLHINGLANISIFIAVLFGLGAMFCFAKYSLTRERHGEILGELASRI